MKFILSNRKIHRKLIKTEKSESINNFAAPGLIAYNDNMKVPTYMRK
jgi:hypothetical protein